MDQKKKRRINRSPVRHCVDESTENFNGYYQRLAPIPIDYLPSPTIISPQQRSSTKTEQINLYTNNQELIYNQNLHPITTTNNRKRPIDNDNLMQEYDQFINKRTRYDQSKSIESENQPPRATIQHRSLFLFHPRHHVQIQNEITPTFNETLPNYHEFCDLRVNHLFENDTLIDPIQKSTNHNPSLHINKPPICLLPPESNLTNPLRTTNFPLDDNKQPTLIRTGNISPAHSDCSTESSSTCSSDEQQFHYHSYHQPSRSFRERENYEQLLDLAEKLSHPNRFEKVDIEQFLSYRYKTITTTTTEILPSKQTACVICMSHFKNGQHIRVLPCLHEYHSKCIARWFTMNSSCPICRRDNFIPTC